LKKTEDRVTQKFYYKFIELLLPINANILKFYPFILMVNSR